jgi:iron complex transport system permease protein
MGLATVTITVLISKLFKNGSSTILLLSGIIVGGFMSAVLSIIKYLSNDITTLASITYWLMGSFESASMTRDYILMGVVVVCVVVLMLISHPINLINQGRSEAQTKGINYNFYRLLVIILSTVLTAISVCFCGTISWIGLVIPHIVRLLAGRDAKRTIPLCITFGATFMVLVDILSRTFTDSEIPLSAVTGLLGTLIFVTILFIKRGKLNEHKDF